MNTMGTKNLATLNREEKDIHLLQANSELRFEVSERSHVLLEVLEGQFELFGSELVVEQRYSIHPGFKGAVFTWQGGKIKLTGNVEFAYISADTPMDPYFKFAVALEQLRIKASRERDEEKRKRLIPRVVVVGPVDTGKSSFCRYLLNYSVRFGRAPIFIDLDVGQNQISVPGTIAGLMVERPQEPTSTSFDRPGNLVLHYGHTTPTENIELYNCLINRMAMCFEAKCVADKRAILGGTIINTCGWGDNSKKESFQALLNIIAAFEATIVVVMESERLYHDITKNCETEFLKIVRLPKSKGVVTRSREVRQDLRWQSFKDYYYGRLLLQDHQDVQALGKPQKELLYRYNPSKIMRKFDEVNLLKVGAPHVPESVLPHGTETSLAELKVVKLPINSEIINHVFSISYCQEDVTQHPTKELSDNDSEDFYETNIAGFVVVTAIDQEAETIQFLSPSSDHFPSKNLLLMEHVTFIDR